MLLPTACNMDILYFFFVKRISMRKNQSLWFQTKNIPDSKKNKNETRRSATLQNRIDTTCTDTHVKKKTDKEGHAYIHTSATCKL